MQGSDTAQGDTAALCPAEANQPRCRGLEDGIIKHGTGFIRSQLVRALI